MSVDKAFEELYSDLCVLSQSLNENDKEIRRLWFMHGVITGQKTLSPEMRGVISRIIFVLKKKEVLDYSFLIDNLKKLLEAGE